ncbi:N-acetylmuramoyl-L-alanine amidase [Paenibacillus alkalitolerans]|uniref:N-acetylmuramoyl-L-alanine amidase n=1 Tax=Paenibacillus alkalitolerans TaxID=2799335 RepID=UPI0018F54A19|nr:N-acetylmuramoyl-L-alanine amidase [Paenibacillus alkalitolerans]
MDYGWKRVAAAVGFLLVAGAVAVSMPGEAQAASKSEPLRVFVDGAKSQLQARSIDGKAYIPADTASALGAKVSAGENGSYIIEFGKQSVRVAAEDTVTFDDLLHFPAASIAESLGARWISDRLTGSLFLFQRLSSSSVPIEIPAGTVGSLPASPSSGDPVRVADALPTFTGISVEDKAVTFTTTGNVQPKIFQLRNPDRIVIDLPGTTLERSADGRADGSLPVSADHAYVSGIRYSLFEIEPSTVRIVLDVKQAAAFRLEMSADGSGASVRFDEKQFRIMIDAGHGGHDPGAISKTGKYEKDFTLAVAKKTAALMEKEKLLLPVLAREGDVYSSPADRAAAANNSAVDLYVSIHANTAPSSSVRGTETYYWRDDSAALAEIIHSNVLKAVGSSDRKVKKNNFLVVKDTTMPAVLLELAFLTNPDDEAKLFNEQIQDKIAEAIVISIKQYYRIP